MKKYFCLLLSIIMIFSGMIAVSASSPNKDYTELLGLNGKMYTTEYDSNYDKKLESVLSKEISEFIVSTNIVNIKTNGESEFVDVIVKYTDGSYENISDIAEWKTKNPNVAFVDRGRILALDKGHTEVTVSFSDFTKVIKVNVLEKIDIKQEILKLEKVKKSQTQPYRTITRNQIATKAEAMIDLVWYPSQNLAGWDNNMTFIVNTYYTGIPYSQTAYQVDDIGFISSLVYSDFYASYTRFNRIMPKYGNDCSGFVSFSWGIPRKTTTDFVVGIQNGTYAKVGSYNAYSPSTSNLLTSYTLLQKGDAVVKQGHTFLIASNDVANSRVYVYEQTPYHACYNTWSYSLMASEGYMPFKLLNL